MEEFKEVVGYNGFYLISNRGKLISQFRLIKCSDGMVRGKKGKVLKGTLCKGYLRAVLVNAEGVHSSHYIHRLVAKHFIPNVDESLKVKHINSNKLDNSVNNLKLV